MPPSMAAHTCRSGHANPSSNHTSRPTVWLTCRLTLAGNYGVEINFSGKVPPRTAPKAVRCLSLAFSQGEPVLGSMAYSSILFAQVRQLSASGRIQSMALSSLLKYQSIPAKAGNFLSQVASIVLPPIHQENGLRYLLLAFSLVTENLLALLAPRSRNRVLH